jgi:hypothetical protein
MFSSWLHEMRRYRALIVPAALLGCTDSTTPDRPSIVQESARFQISDGANGGARGFYFLPPIAEEKPRHKTLDGALLSKLEVRICALPACASDIAVFSNSTSPKISIAPDRTYSVKWATKGSSLSPATNYRIRVLANTLSSGSVLLGFADVDVVANRKELNGVTSDYVGLVKDASLDIKFQVETGFMPPWLSVCRLEYARR